MTHWWYNLSELIRFRIRFLIFEGIVGTLLVVLAQQGVFPVWATIAGVMASGILAITFVSQVGVTEMRFQQQGLDIEGRDLPWH